MYFFESILYFWTHVYSLSDANKLLLNTRLLFHKPLESGWLNATSKATRGKIYTYLQNGLQLLLYGIKSFR